MSEQGCWLPIQAAALVIQKPPLLTSCRGLSVIWPAFRRRPETTPSPSAGSPANSPRFAWRASSATAPGATSKTPPILRDPIAEAPYFAHAPPRIQTSPRRPLIERPRPRRGRSQRPRRPYRRDGLLLHRRPRETAVLVDQVQISQRGSRPRERWQP